MVDDPRLIAIEESGTNHGHVDLDCSLVLQVFVVPNAFVQSTK